MRGWSISNCSRTGRQRYGEGNAQQWAAMGYLFTFPLHKGAVHTTQPNGFVVNFSLKKFMAVRILQIHPPCQMQRGIDKVWADIYKSDKQGDAKSQYGTFQLKAGFQCLCPSKLFMSTRLIFLLGIHLLWIGMVSLLKRADKHLHLINLDWTLGRLILQYFISTPAVR